MAHAACAERSGSATAPVPESPGGASPPGSRLSLGWLAAFAVTLILTSSDHSAQPEVDLSHWRFYSSTDGLRESWVEDITQGSDGRVWITHGSVDAMTVFDGYEFRRLPTPGPNLTVREGSLGQVWAFHRSESFVIDGLQEFANGTWTVFTLPEIDSLRPLPGWLVPWAPDRVLVMGADRAGEFNRQTGAIEYFKQASETPLSVFRAVEPRRGGGAWIGGRGHLAIVEPGKTRTPIAWHVQALPEEFANHEVRRIHDLAQLGLFITVEGPDGHTAAIALHNQLWTVIARSSTPGATVYAWSTSDESWIITTAARTFDVDLTDTRDPVRRRLRRSRALSGAFHTALVQPEGSFWIATSLGLARHAPPVWRTPPELGRIERHVSTLFQSRRGDLFALSESVLLWRPDGEWRIVPLPEDVRTTDFAGGVAELPDGSVIFNGPRPDRTTLLRFDPVAGGFDEVVHPEGRAMVLLANAPPGRLWLHTRAGNESRLETYDGHSFTTYFEAGPRWSAVQPRGLIVASTGEILVLPEQTGVGWLDREGRYTAIGAAEGYPGAGPFCGLELSPNRFWLGDRDGIVEYADGQWRIVRSGMQTVRSLVRATDGTIWAATGSGLHAYRDGSWVDMTAAEGLPDAGVFDVLQDRSGTIWASTSLALSRMYPATDVEAPQTTVDSSLNPREAPPSGEVRITFAGYDRWHQTPAARLLFSWRVNGGPWSPFSRDAGASLHGLRAGQHYLDVRAMDRNWNVDPSPASFQFAVLQPWYREPGFLAVGIAGALSVVAVIGLVTSRHLRLGRLVADRTRELAETNRQLRYELEDRQRVEEEHARLESQLHQAQKLEAIGRLAGGIAHDFNNLLTVITSYGEMMREDLPPNHPLILPVQEIVAAADRATGLTRQLLAFSRHQVRRTEVLDLNAVIADMERMLRRLIGEDLELEFTPGDALRSVMADRSQIEQVIMNLAVNARDAMPTGGKLTISTANIRFDEAVGRAHIGAAPGEYVLLGVSDTGIGMDADTQSRIFDPFFTTKGRDQGTGLGLATVYGIVKQAGGHIWVESEPGKGSTFQIYLPATDVPVSQAQSTGPALPVRGAERVLLVEDEDSVRALASKVLRSHGYTVVEASSAEAAEELLARTGPVDLVLSDIVLSGMTGPQFVEKLRASTPDVRVLFMSGYADDTVVRHGILEGEVPFIQKPFTPHALARKVRETLDAR